MDIVSTDLETMAVIKSETEFNQAKLKGFWQTLFSTLTRQRTHLLSLNEVVKSFDPDQTMDRGVMDIPLERIVGSVSRSQDYTRQFSPSTQDSPNRERWRAIYRLIYTGAGFPPIEVYQVGDQYFVLDGHHRVSVAHHVGWQTIQAHVTELPPLRTTAGCCVSVAEREDTMRLMKNQTSTSKTTGQFNQDTHMLRLVLYKDEVCRLPQSYNDIRVLSGHAWITVDGRDMFLNRGDRETLSANRDVALISALKDTPLVVEIRGDDVSSPDILHLTPQRAC